MLKALKILKKLPVDFGQHEMRERTKGKLIAFSLVSHGDGKRALDLGCRDGYWSEKFKKRGFETVSIDIESSYPTCLISDANKKFPFMENSFDLIWCSEVIEHLDDPFFSVSEMRRTLRHGGRLILTTPNSDFWFFRLLKYFGVPIEKLQSKHHKQFFSLADIKTFFPNAKIFGFFPYFILKFKILNPNLVNLLSPTFVIYEEKE